MARVLAPATISRRISISRRVSSGEGAPSGEAAEDYAHRWVTVEEAEDLLPPRLAIVLDWAVARLAGGHLQP